MFRNGEFLRSLCCLKVFCVRLRHVLQLWLAYHCEFCQISLYDSFVIIRRTLRFAYALLKIVHDLTAL